jgi:hypothetical protein
MLNHTDCMDGRKLVELSKQTRAIPEFARVLELNHFSNTVRIVETNYQELDRLLWVVCETPAGEELFFTENRSAWREVMAEVIRLLQNLAASVSALIEHSRCLYRHMYQESRQFPEYEKAVTAKISTDEVIQFVQGIANYSVHHANAGIGTTMTVVDMQNDKFEKQVTVTTADLLDFAWNDAAMRFIDHAPQSIDLRQTLKDYHKSIEAFSVWFSQRTRVLNAADYQAVSDYLSRARDYG